MKSKEELRIVAVISNLGLGKYLSEDVFTQEMITIKLRGKQRIHLTENITGKIIYVALNEFDDNYARYIYSWRDLYLLSNDSDLVTQKQVVDTKFAILRTSTKLTMPEIIGI